MVKFINMTIKMNNPIINLDGVDIHQMEQQIFSNITLKIAAGDFIYLVGETGSEFANPQNGRQFSEKNRHYAPPSFLVLQLCVPFSLSPSP